MNKTKIDKINVQSTLSIKSISYLFCKNIYYFLFIILLNFL